MAKTVLGMWCDAITRNQGVAFAKEWVLEHAVLETPIKKRRTHQEKSDAVAQTAETDQPAVADAAA